MKIGNWSMPNSEQQAVKTNPAEAEIAENSGETEELSEITLQPRSANTRIASAANIDEIIKAFQLSDTPATRGLVSEMARGGIELTAENIDIMSRASEAFSELKPEQLVFMAREGIPLNALNTKKFQQFLEHKNLVGEQLSNILEQLPAELSEKPVVNVEDAVPASRPEITSLPEEPPVQNPEKPLSSTSEKPITLTSENATAEMPEKPQTNVWDAVPASRSETTTAPETTTISEKPQTNVGDAVPASRSETTTSPETTTISEKPPANVGDADPASRSETTTRPETTTSPETTTISEKPPANVGGADPASRPETTTSPETTTMLEKPPANVGDADPASRPETTTSPETTTISEKPPANVGDAVPASRPEAVPLPEEKPMTIEQKIISLFKKVDSKNPHTLPKELNARELVRELTEVIETVKEKLPELEPSRREALGKAVAELEQSVKFLDKLNNYTPIVNIPLQWGNERTTAELYVFNDSKRGRKIDPQNATMFVSLMTANAGRVETMIKILGKNVECDFSVELPETAETVRGEMHTLYKLLDAQGFKLARSSAKTAERTADIFDVSKVREQNKSRYFFDRKV